MSVDLKPVSYDDLRIEVDRIVSAASKLKSSMVISLLRQSEINQSARRSYEIAVESYIKFWSDYADKLKTAIRGTTPKEDVYTIDWDCIHDLVYCKHDYNSILLFADGVLRGIGSGRFDKSEDIIDFMDHTINKAFNGLPGSVVDILNAHSIDGNMLAYGTSDVSAVAKFKAMRTYDMFDRRAGTEMYQAIVKAINTTGRYIKDSGIGKTVHARNIIAAVVNTVIEYASYTMTAYAHRILMISTYAVPFIFAHGAQDSDAEPHKESTEIEMRDDGEVFTGDKGVTIMRDLDDIKSKDVRNVKDFVNAFTEFLVSIGCDLGNNTPMSPIRQYVSRESIHKHNSFAEHLLSNNIFQLIDGYRYDTYHNLTDIDIRELHHLLKDNGHNMSQGLSDSATDKQTFLHIIKGTNTDDSTLKDYQDTALSLSALANYTCIRLASVANTIAQWIGIEADKPKFDIGTKAMAKEALKMLEDLYGDLAGALLFRARDLEMKINVAREDAKNKAFKSLEINVPGEIDVPVETIHSMMSAVPDTTRAPANMITDDLPTFEYLELRDMLFKELPLFEGVKYYSEAFSFSSLLNKLIALFQGTLKRMQGYKDNKDVQEASAWVTRNENEILAIDMTQIKMNINNYKSAITLPDGFNNFQSNLSQFNEKNVESQEAMDAFVKSLYPSDTVYGWFHTKDIDKKKQAASMYKNLLLYYPDAANSKPEVPAMISVTGEELRKRISDAIETLKGINSTYDSLIKIVTDINTAFTNVRSKVAAMTNEIEADKKKAAEDKKPSEASSGNTSGGESNTEHKESVLFEADEQANGDGAVQTVNNNSNSSSNNDKKPGTQSSSSSSSSTDTQKREDDKKEHGVNTKEQVLENVLMAIEGAFNDVINPVHPTIVGYVSSQYKWIRNLYNANKQQ